MSNTVEAIIFTFSRQLHLIVFPQIPGMTYLQQEPDQSAVVGYRFRQAQEAFRFGLKLLQVFSFSYPIFSKEFVQQIFQLSNQVARVHIFETQIACKEVSPTRKSQELRIGDIVIDV